MGVLTRIWHGRRNWSVSALRPPPRVRVLCPLAGPFGVESVPAEGQWRVLDPAETAQLLLGSPPGGAAGRQGALAAAAGAGKEG